MTNLKSVIEHRAVCAWNVALAAGALCACGGQEPAETTPANAVAAAYAALDTKLEPCFDAAKSCVTEANGDRAKLEACVAAAQACGQDAFDEEQNAFSMLVNAVRGCFDNARSC